jgi:hypothetical protein
VGSNRTDLAALKNMISEADRILETAPALPENRANAARDFLRAALKLADDLIKNAPTPAAALGHKGGSVTARRHGPEHYRQMAAKRKTHGHGSGRPRKQSE